MPKKQEPTRQSVARLTQEVYEDLEKKLRQPVVGPQTSQLEAAYILGQQSVLKLLRGGYTIGL